MNTTLKTAKLLFAGGGTGGHLFPALAIADRIKEMLGSSCDVQITFVGTRRGIEYRLQDSMGYPLRLMNIRGISRTFTLKNLLVPFLIIGALCKARTILKELVPDVVIGSGGYVSWPALKMAAWRDIPTVLQEQNSFPGVTTRQLAANAKRVYLGFEEAKHHLPSDIAIRITGNPVRNDISEGNREEALSLFGLDPNKKTILILGGSQGARSVNDAVLSGLLDNRLPEEYQLLWQTGKRDYKEVVASAGEKGRRHSLFPFENRMALVYAAADLAVARAGAITLAELEACSLPAILIPYPFAAGDHQRKNAQACVDRGFARMIDQKELSDQDLLANAIELFESGAVDRMREAIVKETAGRKPATDVIAEDIIELIAHKQEAVVES